MKPQFTECVWCFKPGYPEFSGLCRKHWALACKDAIKAEALLRRYPPTPDGQPSPHYTINPGPRRLTTFLCGMAGGAAGGALAAWCRIRYGI